MMVREVCDLMYLPSIFDPDATSQDHVEGKQKADAMFESVMADPEAVRKTVDGYACHLKNCRIESLKAELAELESDD
jgi:hypothetical protein